MVSRVRWRQLCRVSGIACICPNSFFQLTDLPYSFLKYNQGLALDHQFFFAPVQIFDPRYGLPVGVTPVLALCPDDLLDEVSSKAQDLGFLLPAASFSELSDDSLRSIGEQPMKRLDPYVPYLGHELTLTRRLDIAATSLPARWLRRQVLHDSTDGEDGQPSEIVDRAQFAQAYLAAYSRFERERVGPISESQLNEALTSEYAPSSSACNYWTARDCRSLFKANLFRISATSYSADSRNG